MDAVRTPAEGSACVCFCFFIRTEKSEHCFPHDKDQLRAGTLPSMPCLICMHGWHSISIVIAKKPPQKLQRTNRRYLAADTQGPITSVRLNSPLLRGILISQPFALLCLAQWAYLQTVSLFRAGDCSLSLALSVCVCVCVREREREREWW